MPEFAQAFDVARAGCRRQGSVDGAVKRLLPSEEIRRCGELFVHARLIGAEGPPPCNPMHSARDRGVVPVLFLVILKTFMGLR
jgi:hypothetical protein